MGKLRLPHWALAFIRFWIFSGICAFYASVRDGHLGFLACGSRRALALSRIWIAAGFCALYLLDRVGRLRILGLVASGTHVF